MRVPDIVRRGLFHWAMKHVATAREPDVTIGTREDRYMLRWWVIPRNKVFNIYLHRILRSDDDRALHDHPWACMTLLLSGYYDDVVPVDPAQPAGELRRIPVYQGDLHFRGLHAAHRLEIPPYYPPEKAPETWSLFFTGPVMKPWGFFCKSGWKPWKKYVVDMDASGSGCGED